MSSHFSMRQILQAEAERWTAKLKTGDFRRKVSRMVVFTNISHYEAAIGAQPGSSLGVITAVFPPDWDVATGQSPGFGRRYFSTSKRSSDGVLFVYVNPDNGLDPLLTLAHLVLRNVAGGWGWEAFGPAAETLGYAGQLRDRPQAEKDGERGGSAQPAIRDTIGLVAGDIEPRDEEIDRD